MIYSLLQIMVFLPCYFDYDILNPAVTEGNPLSHAHGRITSTQALLFCFVPSTPAFLFRFDKMQDIPKDGSTSSTRSKDF